MGELLSVKVSIANRNYPLRITAEEQEKVLSAAQEINKRMREIEENYAVKDKQDLLAMSALQLASEAVVENKSEKKDQQLNEMSGQIDYLCLLIDDYLDTTKQ